MGTREKAAEMDFSGISLEEEVESQLKEAAVVSMGTEVSEEDMLNIIALCDQVSHNIVLTVTRNPGCKGINYIGSLFCIGKAEVEQLLTSFVPAIHADESKSQCNTLYTMYGLSKSMLSLDRMLLEARQRHTSRTWCTNILCLVL